MEKGEYQWRAQRQRAVEATAPMGVTKHFRYTVT